MVIVTHEIGFTRKVANRISSMTAGAITIEAPQASNTDDRPRSFLSKVLSQIFGFGWFLGDADEYL